MGVRDSGHKSPSRSRMAGSPDGQGAQSDRQTVAEKQREVTYDDTSFFLSLLLPSRKEANINSSTQQCLDRPEGKQKGD